MSVRSTVVAVVVGAVTVFAVSASAAADQGHSATQEAMDEQVAKGAAPGVLAQAEDGGGVWKGASGTAERTTLRPPLAGDRFRIGSLTKPFVAAVVLQLAAEGKVGLDDPVERWLPGTLKGHGHDGRRVTVRQLLGHTSGVYDFTADPAVRRDYFGPGFLRSRYEAREPAAQVRTAMRHAPSFAPGAGWEYSNTNYVLVGMVVERVTGRSYAEEVERRITRPLGLDDTSLPGGSPRIAGPHGRSYSTLSRSGPHAPVYDVTGLDPSLAGAAGEMISSTDDLIRFMRALLGGDVLPPRQLREMKSAVPTGDGSRYGLGLTVRRLSCGTEVWGHEGTIQGSRSTAVTTADGAHSAAFNINGDWSDGTDALLEAEYCG
ncbi:D-alanyl-D-alanine carboxypeptidase [Streptomyces daqingensis]|uniref:D-alanyl-D-alanine carboxypeptidase n=1 Tax=Streptomyces daqingensis TaxID=1472640 RepID=A0ABQ2M6E9_9ACTN|nr:serine hydrolase domain-containing protein [Streptomyces daqingensis]GGO47292.1 D-alanyl-D-alanine carboxypeptidase [Streptomyces daqingensis]